jgi:hypothetical protein
LKILVFGNPALPSDNLALKVGETLKKDGYDVVHLEDPLGLLKLNLSDAVILDVAEGVQDVTLLTDVDKLVLGRLYSLHDFDMAYFLKLMKQLGKLGTVRIVALPRMTDVPQATESVRALLAALK